MATTAPRTAIPAPRWATAPARAWWTHRHSPHAALAAIAFAAYLLCSILRYQRYGETSYDLGIFTEAVKAYAHLNAPVVPIKGPGYNILGDHLSPATAVLAPLWWLWPSPLMLLTAQAGLFAWSAGIVSATATRLLGLSRGLCVAVAYALSFGLQRAVDSGFHEIAFAVPILAMVCRQFLARRWQHAAWWSMPLLLVKEDLGLTVAVIGLLITVQGRRRITGPALAATGIAVTTAAIWWIIPHFNPHGHYDYWAMTTHHQHWWTIAWHTVNHLQTWKTIGWTFAITGLLATRSPLAALAVPTLLWRLASTNPYMQGTDWHYSATLMPIVFLAAADTARRIRTSRRLWLRQYTDRTLTALPAVALACCASMTYGIGDLARADAWTDGTHQTNLTAALKRIPDGATVEATNDALAPLAARADVYWYGAAKTPVDFIVYDRDDWKDAPKPQDAARIAGELHKGAVYQLVYARGGVSVVRLAR
jgi:uncharacterized membrane protein